MDLENDESRFSYLGIAATLFISVLFANLLSLFVVKMYLDYQAEQTMAVINKQIESTNAMYDKYIDSFKNQQIEMQSNLAEKRRQAQIEIENRNTVARMKRQTCEFWNQQLASNNTKYNRLMREKACQY